MKFFISCDVDFHFEHVYFLFLDCGYLFSLGLVAFGLLLGRILLACSFG